jgi:hypothetical protein
MTKLPTMNVEFGAPTNENFLDTKGIHFQGYTCTLRYKGRRLTTSYYMGPALCREPEVAEVLFSLISDAQSVEFDNLIGWMRDMGYELEDYERAERIYKQCEQMSKRLQRFLGDDFDAIWEAVQDT